MPVPTFAMRQHGERFPCEQHACGCTSARGCWEQCCCYSPREKLAWARRNNIEAPSHLVAELARLDEAEHQHDDHEHDDHDDDDHCGHDYTATDAHVSAACCHNEHTVAASACCDKDDHDAPAERSCCQKAKPSKSATDYLLGIRARQCRGIAEMWCLSGAVAPPLAVGWQFQWEVVEWVALDLGNLRSGELTPPVPPPRI